MTPNDKKSLRRELLARMKSLGDEQRSVRSVRAIRRLFSDPGYQRATTVAGFVSFGDEINTDGLLQDILNSGKRLGLPRAESKAAPLVFHAVNDLASDVRIGPLGFREPDPALPTLEPSAFDLIIIPGLGFDEHCNRLGRGAGHYDRFLEHANPSAFRVALAFECQILPAVPVLPHDLPVHAIITEDRVIRSLCQP